MRKSLCLISFVVAMSWAVVECPADDGSIHLENGLRAYRETADFETAISELQKALQLGLSDRTELIQAHLYMGFAHIGQGQRSPAEAEFEKAIKLDPTLELDPKLHSSKIITVFNETKGRLVDSLTVVSVPGGAQVYVGEEKPTLAGITPLSLDMLIGEHTLRIVKEYFQTEVLTVRVEKGGDNRVQVQLDKAEMELRITSEPSGAAVYVSGADRAETAPRGRTPLSLKAALDQELTIKLAREEFLDKELKVKLTEMGVEVSGMDDVTPFEDGAGSIHVGLERAPVPGSLKIASDPSGATVYLDGIDVGETPLTIARVTPGTRTLRVSMFGFTSVTRNIEVVSDEETSVQVALGGQLHVLSIPTGTEVFIDEEYAGTTPLTTGRIPAGSHQLRLSREKYRDRLNAVVVERGQVKEVKIRLLPLKGSIAVSSDPPDASVYLDGESKGSTPLFIYGVMVGKHSLKLTKPGYEDWEKQITVQELEVSWHPVRLRKQT